MGADRLIEADRNKGRSARGAVLGFCCAMIAAMAGPPAWPSAAPAGPSSPAGQSRTDSDSLSSGSIDDLLEAWSDLYLGVWSDSLEIWALDSMGVALQESLAFPLTATEKDEGPRVVISTGCEVEGLDESFGPESLSPLTSAPPPTEETPGTVADTTDLVAVRFAERQTAPRVLLGLTASTASTSSVNANLRVESRTGEEQVDVTAEVHGALRRGAWRTFSVRDLFLWEKNGDEITTGQNLLSLRWRQPGGTGRWRLGLSGTLDVSRSDDADLVIEPSGSSSPDSTLRLNYLNHERYDMRVELWQPGLHGTTLAVRVARKDTDALGGSYTAGSAEAHRTWFLAAGLLDADLDIERRGYDDEGSALGSHWESELSTRWLGESRGHRLDAHLQLLATLQDEPAADGEDFLVLADDQITARLATLVYPGSAGGFGAPRQGAGAWAWEWGAGPTGELIRTRSCDGDAAALGLRLEGALRRAREDLPLWIDGSAEFGWRVYRNRGVGSRLAYEGFRLSLAQSDCSYAQASLVAGGSLPWSLAWEAYVSFDQEWHALSEDDARLFSFSVALQRLWVLCPG